MSIVKGNGYGHGAITVARSFIEFGANYLGVASLDEAIQLRCEGIDIPIMILGYVAPCLCEEIVKNDITATIYEEEMLRALSVAAVSQDKAVKVHIKVDTGMMRIGVNPDEAVKFALKAMAMPGIAIEGIYTHFTSASEEYDPYTRKQFERFIAVTKTLADLGLSIPLRHVCNSPASMHYPEMHLDMVRLGYALYGCYTSPWLKKIVQLKQVMSIKALVVRVKEVNANVGLSYGRKFTTTRKSRIATISFGFGDGINNIIKGNPFVIIKGQTAPIVGVICMDYCMVDITDIEENIKSGDIVALCSTLGNGEIVQYYDNPAGLSMRVPRYYIKNNKLMTKENYLI
jgi:alanine racemase